MPALSLTTDTPDLAEYYEAVSADRQFKAGRRLIERLAIKPGARVLDVGSGTGLLAEYVAEQLGASGSVLAIDPLPLRIEIAKRRTTPNLEFQVGSAYALDHLPQNGFDVVYLNAVFHWLPEKRAPLRSILRLLKPAGRLGISTGAREQPSTLQEARRRVLERDAYSAASEADNSVAHYVSAEELSRLFRETGFEIEHLALEAHSTHHASAEAALQFAQASSFGNYLGRIPEGLREAARRDIVAELEKLRDPEGIPQHGTRIVAVARKPKAGG